MNWFKKEQKEVGDIYSYLKSLNIYMEEMNNNINRMHSIVTDLDSRIRGLRDSVTKINNHQGDQREWAVNLAAKLFKILDEIKATKTPIVVEKNPKKEKKYDTELLPMRSELLSMRADRVLMVTDGVLGIFEDNKIIFIRDLVSKTEEELLLIHGLGKARINKIKELLSEYGLTLGMKAKK